jgi:predicted DNA-binding ribbon-helix-helix protein
MAQKPKTGRVSLFRGKVRGKPLTVTLTPRHWRLLDDAAERLQLTRADLVGLMIHRYARSVQLPARLRDDQDDEQE